jgi:hypothetical protein
MPIPAAKSLTILVRARSLISCLLKDMGLPEREHESPSKQQRNQDVDDKIGGKTDEPVEQELGWRRLENEIGETQE